MGVLYYVLHPNQLKAIIQWKVWHEPVHSRDASKETPTQKECFKYLNQTSRSFAAVIQELHPELLMSVTVFYLVLRGLDTIEDDMTIDIKEKEPVLRNFHKTMQEDGWSYDGCAPKEPDRDLLVHFDCVVQELKNIPRKYYDTIYDITVQMGNGMADYARNAEFNEKGVDTIADYEKYCHYVAGLVGEGLTRLLVVAELANPRLGEKKQLTESMGQFLQKTNIIRDIREDWDLGRRWWPREIWTQYFDKFEDMFLPANRQQALWCLNHMVLDALKHADDCLFYMAGVKEQSVFNFVAIPQSMAIATLEAVFGNPDVFDRNVKISKGDACQLMTDSTQSLLVVCDVFRRYARRIHQKADPRDPNYLAISMQCGKIEQFIETIFPRQTPEKQKRKYDLKSRKDPTMDVGDGMVLVLVVIMAMVMIALVMIFAAWGANWYFKAYYPRTMPHDLPGGPGYQAPGDHDIPGYQTPGAHEEL